MEALSVDERRAVCEVIDRRLSGVMHHTNREWLTSARDKLTAGNQPCARSLQDQTNALMTSMDLATIRSRP